MTRRRGKALTGVRRTAGWLVALGLLAALALFAWSWARRHPQNLPWTPLDLTQPVGMATGRKLAALTQDFGQCRALLTRAGVKFAVLPVVGAPDAACGYADGVRLLERSDRIDWHPRYPGTACAVAAALTVWEWETIQPAAQRHFGQAVTGIDQLGSYNCRRLYGRASGSFSEHATADAIDVAGFRLADGTRVSVLKDWSGGSPKAQAFLRDVRDGACRLFATTLSPDYNAAHRDHFHLDQADRAMGWSACR